MSTVEASAQTQEAEIQEIMHQVRIEQLKPAGIWAAGAMAVGTATELLGVTGASFVGAAGAALIIGRTEIGQKARSIVTEEARRHFQSRHYKKN